ncbi:hypothetical protein LTR53_015326 [Teratosphaeriaceae sp. CCFEE 6253]|nr:hypothetical protein LTR53_015326 [Teratosphaeriaceae sp. CCFEE 6253]
MDHPGKAAFEYVQNATGHIITALQQIKWEDLSETAKAHITDGITNNPKTTIFQIIMLVLAVVPGVLLTPALTLLGFGSLGPIAGSWAAAFQAANGATWGFSVAQSLAMGGQAIVGTGVTVVATAAGAVTEFFKWHQEARNGSSKL